MGKKFTRQRIKIFLASTGPPRFLASVIFGKFFGTNHFHSMDPRDAGRSKILGGKMSHDQKIGKIKSWKGKFSQTWTIELKYGFYK